MYGSTIIFLTLVVTFVQGFFFLMDKKQKFYCSTVCSLYCPEMGMDKESKRSRRHAGHYGYYEPHYYAFPPYIEADEFEDVYHGFYRLVHKKTTTTPAPTTTEEPTLICQLCKNKCKR